MQKDKSISRRQLVSQHGFTIVELLIVIVVIGILAAIAIVSYRGIQARASETALKSELGQIAKLIEIDRTMLGYYPASETEIASGQGLPDSRNNIFQYEYESDSFYCLTGTSVRKGVPTYFVSTTKNTPTAGTCPNYVDPHSSTGDSWTAHPAAEQNEWTSIAFGGGKFVAVSKTGTHRVMTSTDGKNWTSHMAAEQNEWNS